MVGSLKMNLLKIFVRNMELSMNSLLPELHNKMELLRERIDLYKKMARSMIHETKMAAYFWAEAVNTSCYVQNRIYIRPILNKTSYELFKGRKPSISYFHQFGCTCYMLNNKHYLKKFSAKAQRGIFIGYSERSKAYRVYNSETNMVEESIHVKFDDKEPGSEVSELSKKLVGIQISG